MSLFVPQLSMAGWTYDNWGANPSTTPGTALTPGNSNADSAWTQIASSANIAHDVAGIGIACSAMASHTNANHQVLMDIGIDPAGGTSYVAEINDIEVGQITTNVYAGRQMFFPFRIAAGSSVAVRARSSNATAVDFRVGAKFYGQVSGPAAFPVGTISETIGATAASSTGTSFTPGNAADGSWVSLGTTTIPLWWWVLCYSVSSAGMTTERTYVDLAYGDGSNKHLMKRVFMLSNGNEYSDECYGMNSNFYDCYFPLPAGSTLYIRGRTENAPDTGYNGLAIGIG